MFKNITPLILLQLFASLLFFIVAQAQTKTVLGTIISQPDGTPMASASINDTLPFGFSHQAACKI